MPVCEYCGSEDVEYTGVDDGGGDYGTSVCDQFHCNHCEGDFEAGCIDTGSDEDYAPMEPTPDDLPDDINAWLLGNTGRY